MNSFRRYLLENSVINDYVAADVSSELDNWPSDSGRRQSGVQGQSDTYVISVTSE